MKQKQPLMAAMAALALAGCGKSPESAQTEAPSSPAQAAPASKELSVFCWSEYIPQSVIDAFSKETGIKVSVENYASNEEMLAKLLAGGGTYDIIQPSEYVVGALVKDGLLHPIDQAKVPNLKNIDPKFLNRSFDPGNKFSVPFMAGTVGIVVNTEKIPDEIRGFADVFTEKYKQNIVVLDDAREIVTWGFFAQGTPINDMSDTNLDKVKPLIAKWLPLVKVYDSDSPKTALLNGDVAIGVVWGGEGAILLNEDKKFKWVIPSEGTHLFIDSLAIPKTSKNVANAEAFMNFILRPEVSKEISDAFPYLNPNLAARELLSPEQRNNAASFPTTEELAKMQVFEDIGQQASKIDEIVTSLKVQ
jgi:spermidine/putrescine transport system permease protein